jgi:hypothetical protein
MPYLNDLNNEFTIPTVTISKIILFVVANSGQVRVHYMSVCLFCIAPEFNNNDGTNIQALSNMKRLMKRESILV